MIMLHHKKQELSKVTFTVVVKELLDKGERAVIFLMLKDIKLDCDKVRC